MKIIHGAMDKSSLEQQFCKLCPLSLLPEKSGAILLVLIGLMAGRQSGRQNKLKFLKSSSSCIFTMFNKGTVLVQVFG